MRAELGTILLALLKTNRGPVIHEGCEVAVDTRRLPDGRTEIVKTETRTRVEAASTFRFTPFWRAR
jgi:hypothetical protein